MSVVDQMLKIPDAASVAALHVLEELLGRRCGGSTGIQFVVALQLMSDMRERNEAGSVVTLICDSGERYAHTCYDPEWVKAQALDTAHWQQRIKNSVENGVAVLS